MGAESVDIFVPKDKEKWLEERGWVKSFDSLTKHEISYIYPTGLSGMQSWKKYVEHSHYTLYIHYDHEGKHYCNLYYNETYDPEVFSLRNIRSMLHRLLSEPL